MLSSGGDLGRKDKSQAFPYGQICVLLCCRICEPIAFMSIFPYIYYMIESFHITTNDKQIALYAGMVTSVFAFAEFMTGSIWGRMSDRLGRKPILLTGLAGTGVSMVIFGFAPNLATALLARAVGGLLNGNIGVIQTTVAEIVTVEAHQARAYALIPSTWCLGSIVGSIIGGGLAEPVRNYPGLFKPGTIFDDFPYLLPNLVCATIVILGMTVGIFFLEETHEDKKERRDMGLEFGNWILARIRRQPEGRIACQKRNYAEETLMLMHEDDLPPDYRSTASSPELSPSQAGPAGVPPPAYHSIDGSQLKSLDNPTQDAVELHAAEEAQQDPTCKRNSSVKSAFTKQVMLNIVGYGILAYHTISAEQLLPVLFSMPEAEQPPRLPFQFTSGFGLSTKLIGAILSSQAAIQMFATIVIFPIVNRMLGPLLTFRLTALSYPLLYLMVPYLTLVPATLRMPCIYLMLIWKVTAQAFAFPSFQIMLSSSAPSTKVLGTLNGVAASAASLCRAFGPTASGVLQSAGLSVGVLGLPWWINACVATVGGIISLMLVEQRRSAFTSEKPLGDDPDFAEDVPISPSFANDEGSLVLVAAEES
ncbi:MFS general substrate transporter [Polychaeton citri CBS 116435]|uniref:MFS general substrate transporter n=1 Tax=Polychaeton citri CBS 116435 TaxID=1314669 RepID=A0A9P4UJR7_9PEZI|nr:MFS general substrate transporter [Polychaeton citri CBS 116435]